jgi:hypothetical protein
VADSTKYLKVFHRRNQNGVRLISQSRGKISDGLDKISAILGIPSCAHDTDCNCHHIAL